MPFSNGTTVQADWAFSSGILIQGLEAEADFLPAWSIQMGAVMLLLQVPMCLPQTPFSMWPSLTIAPMGRPNSIAMGVFWRPRLLGSSDRRPHFLCILALAFRGVAETASIRGLMDEVAIYSRALTDSEILAIFNS